MIDKAPATAHSPSRTGPGVADEGRVAATRLFRLLNPELFVRPSPVVGAVGAAVFLAVVGYFALDNYACRQQREEERRRYEERLYAGSVSRDGQAKPD